MTESNHLFVTPPGVVLDTEHDQMQINNLKTPSFVTSGSLAAAKQILTSLLSKIGVGQPNKEGQQEQFFRYVRGQDYSGINNLGGITFFISLNARDGKFTFSMAHASDTDNFSKYKGRDICKNRFENGMVFEIERYDSKISIVANIYSAMQSYLLTRRNKEVTIQEGPCIKTCPSYKHMSQDLSKAFKYMKKYYTPSDILSYVYLLDNQGN